MTNPKEVMKATEKCPTCKKPFHWRRRLFLERGSYGKKGRPRSFSDYDKIYKLRDSGLSLSGVAGVLKITKAIVIYALKKREKG